MNGYTVSPKAHGELFFLIYQPSGIWLVSTKLSYKIYLLQDELVQYNNTVLVGELVTKDRMRKSSYLQEDQLFLTFDVLMYKGENLHLKNYNERRKHMFSQKIKNYLKIEPKKIIELGGNSDSFYKNMKRIFDMERKTLYKTDGIIFTPINSGYIADGQFVTKTHNRCLSLYNDVCKYKLAENLTIDFYVKNRKLYVYDKGNTVLFKGSYRIPFSEKNYRIEDNQYEDKIVEFEPTFSTSESDGENKTIVFIPRGIREDKLHPNGLTPANNIWSLLQKPISKETLLGENITLLRKYHNKIKKNLINQIRDYVVDIGSGNGGDLFKYEDNQNIKKVLSVEPNENFIKEFMNRLDKTKNKNKFIQPLQAGGEESDKIYHYCQNNFPQDMKGKDLNITFMLTLSFFWKDKETLNKLIQTIQMIYRAYVEKGGDKNIKIYYLTIVGSKVRDLFHHSNEVKLNTIMLKKINNKEYYVDIEDSVTVFSQIEYYVNLEDLENRLNLQTISKDIPKGNMPEDYVLSEGEKIYTSLFQYGVYQAKSDITNIQILPLNILAEDNIQEQVLDQIDKDIYRVKSSTKDSLYYSIFWLLSSTFRKGDNNQKKLMIQKFKSNLYNSINLNYISRKINYNIVIFDKYKHKEKIETGKKNNYIFLYKIDKNYEPIIYKQDDELVLTFSDEFFLV